MAREALPASAARRSSSPSSRMAGAVWSTAGRIGNAMDDLGWRPAKRPDRTPLTGDTVLLEPLEVARHGEELYASTAGADSTWDYLPYGPFAGKGDFMAWLEQRAPVADPLTFTPTHRQSHTARGLASFTRIVPEH